MPPRHRDTHAPQETPASAGFSGSDPSYATRQQPDTRHILVCGGIDTGKSTVVERLQEAPGCTAGVADAAPRLSAGGLCHSYFDCGPHRFLLSDVNGAEVASALIANASPKADIVILVVDGRQGLSTQDRHLTYLAAALRPLHVILVVNHPGEHDLDPIRFQALQDAFATYALKVGLTTPVAIPVAALDGDNVAHRSARTPWYHGPTLLDLLKKLDVSRPAGTRLVMPIQRATESEGGGIIGTIAEGQLRVGDEVRLTASGQTARVTQIITANGPVPIAGAGEPVTLPIAPPLSHVEAGDILALSRAPLEMTDQFEATLVWMSGDAGLVSRNYDFRLSTQSASASVTSIKYRVNVDSLSHEACRQMEKGDILVCNLALSRHVIYDTYERSRELGSFFLLDKETRETVATGFISHSLRRAQNVHRQALSIHRRDRERLNDHPGKVVWFTGLSGSGKSTLANALEVAMHARGIRTYILDGDNVRHGLNKDLGFTDADRVENIRRVAEVARLMMDAGLIVITAFISPFRREREMARDLIGADRFVEVYVSTPLGVCEHRDTKGLYKKAREGKIPNLTGINSPYETPSAPTFVINTDEVDIEPAIPKLIDLILA